MSKELPYFKFFPDQWLSKKITLESFETQGLFVNVCSIYWANDCDIKIATLSKRYGEAINILIENGYIKDKNGVAKIGFLDSQYEERYKIHKELSNSGKAGAEKRWGKNRGAIRVANKEATEKSIAIRKDKIRKDKTEGEEFVDEKYNLKCAYIKGELLYGNEHQRGQGGMSDKSIEEHCKSEGIVYEK